LSDPVAALPTGSVLPTELLGVVLPPGSRSTVP
jgi:hypothetical protein